MAISAARIMQFNQQLLIERARLREDIHRELIRADEEIYSDIAGQVADSGDASVADLLADVSLATIDRQTSELQAVEAALKRISLGRFGVCESCGEQIAPERLEKHLSASHCLICQGALEYSASREFDVPRL